MNVPVIIVGAGPTGLTAATLLAQNGVECLVLERWESVYPQPRAVHLDDEVYRILARLGLGDAFAAISRPCRGLRLSTGTCGCWPSSGATPTRAGTATPRRTCSTSPSWNGCCATTSAGTRTATIRGNVEVTALTQDGDGPVRVEVTDRATGGGDPSSPSTSWAATAPTASTRAAIGATHAGPAASSNAGWSSTSPPTADLGHGTACTRSATRDRAATYMRVGSDPLPVGVPAAPGETADDFRDIARLHPLISPVDQGHPRRAAGVRPGRRIHLPRPGRRPVARPPGLPARRRRPPHPAVHRPGHGRRYPRRRQPRLETRRRPATAPCPTACWTPTRPNANPTPAP